MFRLLIVDDEPSVCQGMKRLIDWNSYGFQVAGIAGNGKQALEFQKENHYDLIITDLKMPVMDGIEFIRQLAEEKENCKIIIVSAYGEFSYAQAAMQYGVKYYLLKPIDEMVLCGFLSKIAEELSNRDKIQLEDIDQKCFERQYSMSANGVITEVRRYINDHYREPLTLNTLAKIYSFSPVYLGRIFKKETGTGFNEYLNKCRIQAARNYLEQEESTISRVSELVGYKDINYFYTCFKRITGFTPGEYKKTKKGE